MALNPGTRLGPYEITAAIGAGGMGRVYQARDTALDRDVAIKVLPDDFASDPDRLARFEREAKSLAALNHPNIAQVFGLETSGDTPAIIMELVEGPTLADRIKTGAIALDEALPIARQIAEALEAAHERGIIHRDLKPANIKVRDDGTVKVLDFGLAKAIEPERTEADIANSPTLTARATQMGVVLGTAAYMAPEQAKGKPVDKRVDVWAFGVVLFEMLTGQRPFEGEDASETLAAVLTREPDLTALPATTPSSVARLIRHCLERDPKVRLRDIGDARPELVASELPLAGRQEHGRTERRGVPLTATVAIAIMAVVAGAVGSRVLLGPDAPVMRRFDISLPPEHRFPVGVGSLLAISPDGQHLVYVATSGGIDRLYHRQFDSTESVPLAGTEGANHPFFSPNSRSVGFSVDGTIATLALEGNSVLERVASFGGGNGYAVWRDDGTILFSRGREGIWSVPATGGDPRRLVEIDPDVTPGGYERMALLPGGEVLVAEARRDSTAHTSVVLISLVTGDAVEIAPGTDPAYLASGHVVFARPGGLWAVPIDAAAMRATGDVVRILGNVRVEAAGAAHFVAAEDGTFLYVAGSAAMSSLLWVDRAGNETEIKSGPSLSSPRLSPNGGKIAYEAGVTDGSGTEIWIHDIDLGNDRRLTSGSEDFLLAWEPAGGGVLFSSPLRDPARTIFRIPGDFGPGGIEPLGSSGSGSPGGGTIRGGDISSDGALVAFQIDSLSRGSGIEVLGIGTGEPSRVTLASPSHSPAISPDGNWIAYVSNDSGRDEVFVTSFPEPGPIEGVSTDGGVQPVWSEDGHELFYRSGRDLFTVPVELDPTFRRLGPPTSLFAIDTDPTPGRWRPDYDYDLGAKRFVVARRNVESQSIRFNVILNYFEELKRLVPVR